MHKIPSKHFQKQMLSNKEYNEVIEVFVSKRRKLGMPENINFLLRISKLEAISIMKVLKTNF